MTAAQPTRTCQLNADRWIAELSTEGYCVIPNLIGPSQIQKLADDLRTDFTESPFSLGGFYGERTKRFGRLLSRSSSTQDLVMHPLILDICNSILGPWCDRMQLNLTQALALHPGARPQFPHRDQDMWRGETGRTEYLVNVMWPFTPYTEENGATVIWPRSHGAAALLEEPSLAPVVPELTPGSALLFLGSTLHGAGGNQSNQVRRGAIISYCLGWLKPYENQWLAYPPEIARHFPTEVAEMVGYVQHRPNLGNFEGQCPSVLLHEDDHSRLAATDALRPDQEAMLNDFIRDQHWPVAASPPQ